MDLNAIDKKSAAIGACAAVVIWIIGGWMFGGDSSSSAKWKWYDYGNGAINLSRVGRVSATLDIGGSKYALSDASYDHAVDSFKNIFESLRKTRADLKLPEDETFVHAYVVLSFDDFELKVSEGTCKKIGDFKDVFKRGLRAYESVLDLVK